MVLDVCPVDSRESPRAFRRLLYNDDETLSVFFAALTSAQTVHRQCARGERNSRWPGGIKAAAPVTLVGPVLFPPGRTVSARVTLAYPDEAVSIRLGTSWPEFASISRSVTGNQAHIKLSRRTCRTRLVSRKTHSDWVARGTSRVFLQSTVFP